VKALEEHVAMERKDLYEDQERCPYCGSEKVIFDPSCGEHVCIECGNVIGYIIDEGPEWRSFTPEQRAKRTRVGAPLSPLRPDQGLSTTIDWRNKDGSGNDLNFSKRIQALRLRRTNKMFNTGDGNEKNLRIALGEIERIGSQLGLPKAVREEAAMLYRKAARMKLIKGRSVESMAAACIYAACKTNIIPRSLDEVSKVSKSDRKEIARSFRLLVGEGLVRKAPPSRAVDFIPRIVSRLDLSMRVQQTAVEILEKARALGLTSGRMPEGLAAAAVYLATLLHGERRTQREIASIVSVTEVTIRNRFKELLQGLNLIVRV